MANNSLCDLNQLCPQIGTSTFRLLRLPHALG
jgi:hypothetical protein